VRPGGASVGSARSLTRENERRGRRLRSGGGQKELGIYMSGSCG
jgi:hypothetical protein